MSDMAAFLCRACGGSLELVDGKSLCRCKFCNTIQSVPLLDSAEKAELCARAETLRREYRYDKAIRLYEELIRLSPTDADLYWALTLCRYGVELSPDGSALLNRIQAHSVLSDKDYKLALKFADEEARAFMEQQAAQIDRIRREGAELAESGGECDIYLCAREADENGRRVMDSVIAAKLYSLLTAEGFRVFFAEKSLEDKSGGEWEPYIFAALRSAPVMIIVGTGAESFDDVWVRNAWSRFTELSGKTMIPALRDMPPSELPEELSKLQALDLSKLGAESDLLSAVKTRLGQPTASAAEPSDEENPLLRRAELFLEDGDFERAEEICAQLLSKEPNNARAYVIKLLAEYALPNENALDDMTENFTVSENYRLAMRYGSEPLRARLKEHSNRSLYKKFTARLESAADNERELLAAAADLRTLGNYSDAAKLAESAEKKAADLREQWEIKHRGGVYELAAKAVAESTDAAVLRSAEHSLRSLGNYKDAPALAEECAAKIAKLPAMQTVTFADDEPKQWKKYLPFAAGGAALLTAALIITISVNASGKTAPTGVISTSSTVSASTSDDAADQEKAEKYAKAAACLGDGNYSEAELIFTALGDYKDSAKMVNECKYQSAAELLENGEYDLAERAFERLGDYSDSRGYILQCRYQKAQFLLENGDTAAARTIFENLDGRWECEDFLKQIEYIEAERLLDAGKYKEARDAFEAIWQYSDSLQRFYESRYKYAAELFENGDYYTAAKEFHELIGYEDSEDQYRRARYYYGLKLEEDGDLKNSYIVLGTAVGYDDWAYQMTRVRNKYIRTKPFDFEFGRYYYTDDKHKSSLRWKVMDIQGDMAFIRADIIDYQPLDDNDPDCTWENGALREWLNGDFYESVFNDSEKAQIRTSVFETSSGDYNYIGTSGSGISDKIFLLNTAEAKRTSYYSDYFYGDIDKTYLSIYAQKKLPKDYGTLFCWGRDGPLIRFYDEQGNELPPDVDATSPNCVLIGMWIYIGD